MLAYHSCVQSMCAVQERLCVVLAQSSCAQSLHAAREAFGGSKSQRLCPSASARMALRGACSPQLCLINVCSAREALCSSCSKQLWSVSARCKKGCTWCSLKVTVQLVTRTHVLYFILFKFVYFCSIGDEHILFCPGNYKGVILVSFIYNTHIHTHIHTHTHTLTHTHTHTHAHIHSHSHTHPHTHTLTRTLEHSHTHTLTHTHTPNGCLFSIGDVHSLFRPWGPALTLRRNGSMSSVCDCL